MVTGEMDAGMVIGEMDAGVVIGEIVGMDGTMEVGTDGVIDDGMDTGNLRTCYRKIIKINII